MRNGNLNGFAVANHSPMPVAMMSAPSSVPTSRETLFCCVAWSICLTA